MYKKNNALSRRALLANLGGASAVAALSPFLPLFQAHAATASPRRFVVFLSNPGMGVAYPAGWKPKGGETDFQFEPGSILEPLASYRDKLVVMDGLDNVAGRDSSTKLEHGRGWGTILSGSKVVGSYPTRGTIDQVIADVTGKSTQFRSLELGVEVPGFEDTVSRAFYGAGGKPVPPQNQPARVFDRVFKNVSGTASPTAAPVDMTAQLRLRAQKKSVLDSIRADLTSLSRKLGADDRQKLDAHLTALRNVETRLDSQVTPASPVSAGGGGCRKPSIVGGTGQGEGFIPKATQLHMELIKSAFACDLTRVAGVQWGRTPSFWKYSWLDKPLKDESHKLSHAASNDASAQSELVRAARWHSQQIKLFLDMLSSVPEGTGTMLDNTIVLWTAEFSKPNSHDWKNMPFLMAGGGAAGIKTGRYLSSPGLPTNRLYTSIARAMGAMVDTVGDPTYGTGTLPGLGIA